MGLEENKAVVRRYIEQVVNRHDIGALDALVSPDIKLSPVMPGRAAGIAGHRELLRALFTGFPDIRLDVIAMVAEHDQVLFTWTAELTHTGPFAGLAPTGKSHKPTGADYVRVADGKIAELSIYSNLGHLLGLPAA
ncbi:MAG: ester cyclase [Candidatus Binatia bacterium]